MATYMKFDQEVELKGSESKIKKYNYLVAGLVLIVSQLLLAIYGIISVKYVKNEGMDVYLVILLRSYIAAILSVIVVFVTERKWKIEYKRSFKEVLYFIVFGLIITAVIPILFLQTIVLTTASYATILSQLVPIFNIIFSFIFGLKKIKSFWEIQNLLEIAGIIIGCSMSTAIIVIGYKMPTKSISTSDWIYGTIIAIVHRSTFSLNHIFQRILFYGNENSLLKNKSFVVHSYIQCTGTVIYTIIMIPYLIINPNIIKNISFNYAIPVIFGAVVIATMFTGALTWCNKKSSPILIGSSFSFYVIASLILLRIFTGETMYLSQYICSIGVMVGVLMVIMAPTIHEYINKNKK